MSQKFWKKWIKAMCGINATFNFLFDTNINLEPIVLEMNKVLSHRGPDDSGLWISDQRNCCLGHRRLSIIDTSFLGHQPFNTLSSDWVLIFNGEIYNYKELKNNLLDLGYEFKTESDTEVLYYLIDYYEEKAVNYIDGMFAFAAFNKKNYKFIVARDPFGEKPLYYTIKNGCIYLSSELSGLEKINHKLEISNDALYESLLYQYIPAPNTIYKNVFKLQPGSLLIINDKNVKINRYYSYKPSFKKVKICYSDALEYLEELLVESIKNRLNSDVPLGAFLSGGIDSSLVVALIRKRLKIDINTFSIGFENSSDSEHLIAREISKYLGTNHFDKILKPNPIEFLDSVRNIADEVNYDSSYLPTYLLSQFAKKRVKVAISGDGGDELFGGYGRYLETLNDFRGFFDLGIGFKYYSNRILLFTPAELKSKFNLFSAKPYYDLLLKRISIMSYSSGHLLDNMRMSDINNYLNGAVLMKVDRMSMQNSLEVRTPFLNKKIADFSKSLPYDYYVKNNSGKVILRDILKKYLPSKITSLPKKGFGLPLDSSWGKKEFLKYAESKITTNSALSNFIDQKYLDNFIHHNRENFNLYQVWSLCFLNKWLEGRA